MSKPEDWVHWARAFKIIREAKLKGIAVYDLADELKVERETQGLEDALNHLKRQGRIKMMMGETKDGIPARVVQIVVERRSSRDTIGLKEEENGKDGESRTL